MPFVPIITLLLSVPASAEPARGDPASVLPNDVRAMIEAAIASRDAQVIETVARIARETQPGASGQIDEILSDWRRQQAAAEARKKAEQELASTRGGSPPRWKGQLEFGASRSTGRTSYLGAVGGTVLEREGPRWRHKLQARAEVQKGRNAADVERAVASWQPNYKFGEALYAYGLGEFEADPAQAYDRRYTASGGLGYTVLNSGKAKLDLEGGPAFRHIAESAGAPDNSVAARASLNLRWTVSPTLELRQAGALYVERGDSNANALTSLDAQLIGPLKARLSYDIRYEDRLSSGGKHLDTLSRATLVYSF